MKTRCPSRETATHPSSAAEPKALPTRSSSTTAKAQSPSMDSRSPTLVSSTVHAVTARTPSPALSSSKTSRPTTARFLLVLTLTSAELRPSRILVPLASRLSARSSRVLSRALSLSPSPRARLPTASTLLRLSRLARAVGVSWWTQ